MNLVESKHSVLARLSKAPGCGVTEVRFGSGPQLHAVVHDGVSWSLHKVEGASPPSSPAMFEAGSVRELIAFLDARWPALSQ